MNAEDLSKALPGMLKTAVTDGLREILKDKELTKDFWEQGYNQLQAHALNNSSQWIGKRVLTFVVTAVVTAGVIWLVKTGAIK